MSRILIGGMFVVLSIVPAGLLVCGFICQNEPIVLIGLFALISTAFVGFEWFINGSGSNGGYRPDLRIWSYGLVLGAGTVVLYLLTDVTTSTIGENSAVEPSADASSLVLWQEGILLFFLSAALAFVMYALVSISRSER